MPNTPANEFEALKAEMIEDFRAKKANFDDMLSALTATLKDVPKRDDETDKNAIAAVTNIEKAIIAYSSLAQNISSALNSDLQDLVDLQEDLEKKAAAVNGYLYHAMVAAYEETLINVKEKLNSEIENNVSESSQGYFKDDLGKGISEIKQNILMGITYALESKDYLGDNVGLLKTYVDKSLDDLNQYFKDAFDELKNREENVLGESSTTTEGSDRDDDTLSITSREDNAGSEAGDERFEPESESEDKRKTVRDRINEFEKLALDAAKKAEHEKAIKQKIEQNKLDRQLKGPHPKSETDLPHDESLHSDERRVDEPPPPPPPKPEPTVPPPPSPRRTAPSPDAAVTQPTVLASQPDGTLPSDITDGIPSGIVGKMQEKLNLDPNFVPGAQYSPRRFETKTVLPILIASYSALKAHDSAGNGVCTQLLVTIKLINPDFVESQKPAVSPQGVTQASTVPVAGTSGVPTASTGGPVIQTTPMTAKTHLQLLKELDGKLSALLDNEGKMSPGVASSLKTLRATVTQSIDIVAKQEEAKGVSQSLRSSASSTPEDDETLEDDAQSTGSYKP